MKWIARTIEAERRRLERARRAFIKDPSDECLHDVRTTGRRLRSLLEDVSDAVDHRKLLRRLKRMATLTDAARDAAIVLALLENSVDEIERPHAEPVVEALCERQRTAMRRARRSLRKMDFS